MKICTMGLGYIGLPTSAMFAKYGAQVTGVDLSQDVIDLLNSGEIHIEEPGLPELVKEVVENGNFKASLSPIESDAYIIAVPTPNIVEDNNACDLSYVMSALNSVIPLLQPGNTVIVESTIAPRSMDDFVKPAIEKAGFTIGKDVFVVHCPERVLPGQILDELLNNNRIVGGITEKCAEKGAEVYELFVKGEIIKTTAKTAEMSKLMENTYRDVNIALANELAKVCRKLEIDVLDVVSMANKHPRVNLHSPGHGVGGHCLAVDPYFIIAKAPEESKMINQARLINCGVPSEIVELTESLVSDKTDKIALLGLTYKPDVDDMRESPALAIYSKLKANGQNVVSHDPHAKHESSVGIEDAIKDASLVLILTNHNEFKEYNWDKLAITMKKPVMFDTSGQMRTILSDKINLYDLGNIFTAL